MDYPEEKTEREDKERQRRKRRRCCADPGLICKHSEDLSIPVKSKLSLKGNGISWAARRES